MPKKLFNIPAVFLIVLVALFTFWVFILVFATISHAGFNPSTCSRDGGAPFTDYGREGDPGFPEIWHECADCDPDLSCLSEPIPPIIIESVVTLPACTPDPSELHTVEIFWYHALGTGAIQQIRWENTSGRDIKVKGVRWFIGVDIGGVCDTSMIVLRGNGHRFIDKGWDHYNDPDGPNHSISESFPSGTHKTILSGEELVLYSYSSDLAGKNYAHGFSLEFVYPECN